MAILRSFPALYVFVHFCGCQAISLDLNPSGLLYVCSGKSFGVECTTNARSLLWNITVPTLPRSHRTGYQRGNNNTIIDMTSFANLTISRISSSPLQSAISADNVTAGLDGTLIVCSGLNINPQNSVSASVELIVAGKNGDNADFIVSPNVSVSERLHQNNITVTIEWVAENGISYTIGVDSDVTTNFINKNNAEVVIFYDTEFNISVVASVCGKNSTTLKTLNYVTCPLPNAGLQSVNVTVHGYKDRAVAGSNISFSCPPGLILMGPNSSTCMETGLWVPNVEGIRCKGNCSVPMVSTNINFNYTSTLEDSLLDFQCIEGLLPQDTFTATCYGNGSWIPNPSNHACASPSAVNCGEPVTVLSDGYVEPYTSTIEGARVNLVHRCKDGQVAIEELICTASSDSAEWVPVNRNDSEQICGSDIPPSSSSETLSAIIGTSVGSCAGILLLCMIIVMTIIVIIKWKSSKQRDFPPSETNTEGRYQDCQQEKVDKLKMGRQKDHDQTIALETNEAYGSVSHHIQTEDNVAYVKVNLRGHIPK